MARSQEGVAAGTPPRSGGGGGSSGGSRAGSPTRREGRVGRGGRRRRQEGLLRLHRRRWRAPFRGGPAHHPVAPRDLAAALSTRR